MILYNENGVGGHEMKREELESRNVRCCGYCELSYLLYYHEPIAFECGVDGVDYEIFEVYGVTICTGDRNMPGKPLDGVQEYEKKALRIWFDFSMSHEEQKEKIEILLQEFCKLNGGRV